MDTNQQVYQRCGFRCVYCGLNGHDSFDNWLHLSKDHLFPQGHEKRDDPEFIVVACRFCNESMNKLFAEQEKEGLPDDRNSLIEWRKNRVLENRRGYREFWLANVASFSY